MGWSPFQPFNTQLTRRYSSLLDRRPTSCLLYSSQLISLTLSNCFYGAKSVDTRLNLKLRACRSPLYFSITSIWLTDFSIFFSSLLLILFLYHFSSFSECVCDYSSLSWPTTHKTKQKKRQRHQQKKQDWEYWIFKTLKIESGSIMVVVTVVAVDVLLVVPAVMVAGEWQ